jgi:anti-anti-sigma factor
MSTQSKLFEPFAVSVTFGGTRVVVGVRGEVDLVSAPVLGAILASVVQQGNRTVVLDLAELDFMDGAGIHVIASAAARLQPLGGMLVVRSPSFIVHRLLDISGVTPNVRIEEIEVLSHLGPEQTVDAAVAASRSDTLTHLRKVTAIPADDDVVDGALRLVVALARATVGGADGVSVSLRRHGHLATVAASDQIISEMDAGQYATGEGPCVDASVHGRWFHVESLDTETRWPDFTPRARALGINAILSTPLLARNEPVGALNIYSRTTAAFATKDQELASVFAAEASTILTDAGLDVTDDELTARLQEALRTRQLIAQAQGVVMERSGISEEAAFTALRHASQSSDLPLRYEAEQVLESAYRPEPDLEPEPDGGHHR